MNKKIIKRLQRICGRENVLIRPVDLLLYSYDASMEKGGIDIVVLPETVSQVQDLVRLAVDEQIPVIPRGSATNLSGGTVAPQGGMVIACSRMNRILEINTNDQIAVVEPGVFNLTLLQACTRLGYFFAPDPASQKVSTLAGNAAMNAGGPHCLKYGVTVNHVTGLDFVGADGELYSVGGRTALSPGYDLTGIMNGSEGTFAIITRLVLRIMPLPEAVSTMLVSFADIDSAANAVSAIIARGIIPATLEFMDNLCIRTVVQSLHVDYPVDAAAVLIIEIDGPEFSLAPQNREITAICRQHGATDVRLAKDEAERMALWAGRRGALGAMTRLKPSLVVFDGTVPRNRLPEALRTIHSICGELNIQYGTLLHAGDGNIHPILVYDERDADESARVRAACERIMKTCVALGGTITGEHGVGMEKIEAMNYLFNPQDLDAMHKLKHVFDPNNILNPGKIFPN